MPWAGLVALVVVAAAEIAARSLVPASSRARGFPNEQIELKTEELKAIQKQGERIDVLFVGSSPIHFGVDTAAFEEAVSGAGRVRAYNAGVNGPDFCGIKAVVDEYYMPHCDPRVIFIGITPNDINAGSLSLRRSTRELTTLISGELPQFLYAVRLFDQRRRFGRFMTTLGRRPLRRSVPLINRGYEDFMALADERGGVGAAERLGNLRVEGPALGALDEFIREHRSNGRTCVLVNLPMRNDYREYVSAQQYRSYVAALESLAHRCEIAFLNLMDAGVVSQAEAEEAYSSFADTVHLKASGAKKLAERLAEYYLECCSRQARADRLNPAAAPSFRLGSGRPCADGNSERAMWRLRPFVRYCRHPG